MRPRKGKRGNSAAFARPPAGCRAAATTCPGPHSAPPRRLAGAGRAGRTPTPCTPADSETARRGQRFMVGGVDLRETTPDPHVAAQTNAPAQGLHGPRDTHLRTAAGGPRPGRPLFAGAAPAGPRQEKSRSAAPRSPRTAPAEQPWKLPVVQTPRFSLLWVQKLGKCGSTYNRKHGP